MVRQNLTAGCDHKSKSQVGNHHKKSMCMFLFSVIGLTLLSLSVIAIMTNAQTSSNSTSGTNSTTSNETGVKLMGICQIGVKSP
jgi:hypothetical protein